MSVFSIFSTLAKPFPQQTIPVAKKVATGIREVSQEAVDLIIFFEKMHRVGSDGRIYPYFDAIGLPTIGVGHLLSRDAVGNPARYKDKSKEELLAILSAELAKFPSMTEDEAKELLNRDLDKFASGVIRLCKVPLSDDQFGALVSFSFNVGLGNLQASTLLRKLNRGDPLEEVADEFLKWNKAGGKVLRGLTNRRKAERNLFLGQYGN